MQDDQLTIRRAIVQLKQGASAMIKTTSERSAEVKAYAEKFARGRKIGLKATIGPDGVTLTRGANMVSTSRYSEMEVLAVGQSHVFDAPPSDHANIRRIASHHNRDGGKFFKCTREGDGLRVTRMPVTEAEREQYGTPDIPGRKTKYDLDRLAHIDELTFDLPRTEHQKLRMAVHRASIKNDWPLKCAIQPDGTLRVIRTDKVSAEAEAKRAAENSAQPKASKYDLDRLATGARLTFDVAPADQYKLRSACSFKSKQTGWTIRCRLQDDGTMLVYRVDAGAPSAGAAAHVSEH